MIKTISKSNICNNLLFLVGLYVVNIFCKENSIQKILIKQNQITEFYKHSKSCTVAALSIVN